MIAICSLQDMVAFSQCAYDGDEVETSRLNDFREHSWHGKFTKIGRVNLSAEEIRRNGKCPLTPLEVFIRPYLTLWCYDDILMKFFLPYIYIILNTSCNS